MRSFNSGDCVLVLLPVAGAALQARFSGPYMVDRKLSDTNFLIPPLDRKKKSRVVYINMLKWYIDRTSCGNLATIVAPVASVSVLSPSYDPQDDGLEDQRSSLLGARLKNSKVMNDLDSYLAHLSGPAKPETH